MLLPCRRVIYDRAPWTKEHAMSEKVISEIAVVGIGGGQNFDKKTKTIH